MILTIGHSNHSIEKFIELLTECQVEVVVDVRSQPVSRFNPHFNKSRLAASLMEAGIQYLFKGKELGGRPSSHEFFDEEGYVLYGKMAEQEAFLNGIGAVISISDDQRLALMCAEENPSTCHRRLFLAKHLLDEGREVAHIRKDGTIEKETMMSDPAQLNLFDKSEKQSWRSAKPSRKAP